MYETPYHVITPGTVDARKPNFARRLGERNDLAVGGVNFPISNRTAVAPPIVREKPGVSERMARADITQGMTNLALFSGALYGATAFAGESGVSAPLTDEAGFVGSFEGATDVSALTQFESLPNASYGIGEAFGGAASPEAVSGGATVAAPASGSALSQFLNAPAISGLASGVGSNLLKRATDRITSLIAGDKSTPQISPDGYYVGDDLPLAPQFTTPQAIKSANENASMIWFLVLAGIAIAILLFSKGK